MLLLPQEAQDSRKWGLANEPQGAPQNGKNVFKHEPVGDILCLNHSLTSNLPLLHDLYYTMPIILNRT